MNDETKLKLEECLAALKELMATLEKKDERPSRASDFDRGAYAAFDACVEMLELALDPYSKLEKK